MTPGPVPCPFFMSLEESAGTRTFSVCARLYGHDGSHFLRPWQPPHLDHSLDALRYAATSTPKKKPGWTLNLSPGSLLRPLVMFLAGIGTGTLFLYAFKLLQLLLP